MASRHGCDCFREPIETIEANKNADPRELKAEIATSSSYFLRARQDLRHFAVGDAVADWTYRRKGELLRALLCRSHYAASDDAQAPTFASK